MTNSTRHAPSRRRTKRKEGRTRLSKALGSLPSAREEERSRKRRRRRRERVPLPPSPRCVCKKKGGLTRSKCVCVCVCVCVFSTRAHTHTRIHARARVHTHIRSVCARIALSLSHTLPPTPAIFTKNLFHIETMTSFVFQLNTQHTLTYQYETSKPLIIYSHFPANAHSSNSTHSRTH